MHVMRWLRYLVGLYQRLHLSQTKVCPRRWLSQKVFIWLW